MSESPTPPHDETSTQAAHPAVRIRPARAEDMRRVAELRWRWSVEESGTAPATDEAGYVAATTAFAAAHPDTHRCIVAEADGEVVGMAWLALTDRPPTPDDLSRVAGDVQSVYVLPALRGSGTGARLVAALLDHARARGCRYVRVHSSARAMSLYARAGFAVDETYRVVRL
ncbi:GNAT superfamily N-acetyltransferase [Clavibacter michiganensis]|uniref:GNAT family N-acetyltransferase n=1 Tax=Clavibacter michiganensis TaxID=28447 RepID=UPI0019591548|nr:GNAT family N-acetyltransferase [Clavibacter michiganensis]MBM7411579.1 GNAT superfamily N-acetyltransferase [Clavibacter michiganensis]